MFIAPISSEHLDPHQRGYPRPQLRRAQWYSLNGSWEFALDPDGVWGAPAEVQWSDEILVPFAPEAPLSGVGHTGFIRHAGTDTAANCRRATPMSGGQ